MSPPGGTGRTDHARRLRIGIRIGVPVIVSAAVVLVLTGLYLPKDAGGADVEVTVSAGMSLEAVADRALERGLIRNRTLFLLAGRVMGVETRIKTGRYRLSPSASAVEILRSLRAGRVALTRITVPEGLTAEGTASVIAQATRLEASEFLAYVDTVDASCRLGFPVAGMEGFLFPNTYLVSDEATPGDIVSAMVAAFHRAVGDSFPSRARAAGLSPHEIVILASIIEKEAQRPEERGRISAVFHNRLKRGWRLEADPTVRYALGRWDGPLTFKDLEVDSPYNTYRVRGLPPGPIANPGLASIEAALEPEPGVEDLYFVARGDGSHEFSKTLSDHMAATAEIRAQRRRRR